MLQVTLDTDSIATSAETAATSAVGWWESLLKKNAVSRARDNFFSPSEIPDTCASCGADPVHFTLLDRGRVWRVCRKCGGAVGTL